MLNSAMPPWRPLHFSGCLQQAHLLLCERLSAWKASSVNPDFFRRCQRAITWRFFAGSLYGIASLQKAEGNFHQIEVTVVYLVLHEDTTPVLCALWRKILFLVLIARTSDNSSHHPVCRWDNACVEPLLVACGARLHLALHLRLGAGRAALTVGYRAARPPAKVVRVPDAINLNRRQEVVHFPSGRFGVGPRRPQGAVEVGLCGNQPPEALLVVAQQVHLPNPPEAGEAALDHVHSAVTRVQVGLVLASVEVAGPLAPIVGAQRGHVVPIPQVDDHVGPLVLRVPADPVEMTDGHAGRELRVRYDKVLAHRAQAEMRAASLARPEPARACAARRASSRLRSSSRSSFTTPSSAYRCSSAASRRSMIRANCASSRSTSPIAPYRYFRIMSPPLLVPHQFDAAFGKFVEPGLP